MTAAFALSSLPEAVPASGEASALSLHLIHREVEVIGQYVGMLRQAINGLRAPELVGQKLPNLRDDLSVIVATTRHATEKVLGTAEEILGCAVADGEYRRFVEDRMIGLMETCAFQDLTGQRMTRVADALVALEQRLGAFISVVRAGDGVAAESDLASLQAQRASQRLTHGPGASGALAQADIDQLLAG